MDDILFFEVGDTEITDVDGNSQHVLRAIDLQAAWA